MILYLETNFIMSLARGQELRAAGVLALPSHTAQIIMPDICLMEAWTVFEKARAADHAFLREINQRIEQLRRDLISSQSRKLADALVQAGIEQNAALNDAEQRFHAALHHVARRCELIASSASAVSQSSIFPALPEERDSLIFATILEHVQANPDAHQILLTDDRDYKTAAETAGLRYFARAEAFLGWLKNQI